MNIANIYLFDTFPHSHNSYVFYLIFTLKSQMGKNMRNIPIIIFDLIRVILLLLHITIIIVVEFHNFYFISTEYNNTTLNNFLKPINKFTI